MSLIASLAVGIAAGYLAQRSRLCFVGGLRDWLLIRDTELLKGVLAFFLAAWIAFPLAALAGGAVWDAGEPAAAVGAPARPGAVAAAADPAPATPGAPRPWLPAALAVAGGLGLGLAATLANGCPLRQHVLAAQGARDGAAFVAGFYAGAVAYHGWVLPWLARVLP